MTQNCPLCGETVYLECDADPRNLTGKFYFCRGNSGGCRATFPRGANAQVSYAWNQPVKWLL